MRWILVRHGQSQFNAGNTDDFDSDITERGTYQILDAAFAVKELLESWGLDEDEIPTAYTLFVSPLQRALKTALPAHSRLGLKPIVDHRIAESADDLRSQKVNILPNRSIPFPTFDWSRYPAEGMDIGAITNEAYLEGLKAFSEEVKGSGITGTIVVSHMGTIKNLASILTGTDLMKIQVPNCSCTLIENDKLIFMGQR